MIKQAPTMKDQTTEASDPYTIGWTETKSFSTLVVRVSSLADGYQRSRQGNSVKKSVEIVDRKRKQG